MKKLPVIFALIISGSGGAYAQSGMGVGETIVGVANAAVTLMSKSVDVNLGVGIAQDQAIVYNEATSDSGGLAQAGLSNQATGTGNGVQVNIAVGVAKDSANVKNIAKSSGQGSLSQAGLSNQAARGK